MQPVSLLMSNMNVEAMTSHAPNALAAAQDTGQSQEIIRDGIRITQRVQASGQAANTQRVHRKNENDERENQSKNDSYHHSEAKQSKNSDEQMPLIRETARTKKRVDFIA